MVIIGGVFETYVHLFYIEFITSGESSTIKFVVIYYKVKFAEAYFIFSTQLLPNKRIKRQNYYNLHSTKIQGAQLLRLSSKIEGECITCVSEQRESI